MNRTILLTRALYILRQNKSKAWNKRTSNNWLVQELVGCEHGTAYKICNEIGIDGDAYDISKDLIYERASRGVL